MTKAADLKVGDIILDGIASRVDVIVRHDDLGEVYMHVEDGNGYVNPLRLRFDADVTTFDWTPEEWAAYRAL